MKRFHPIVQTLHPGGMVRVFFVLIAWSLPAMGSDVIDAKSNPFRIDDVTPPAVAKAPQVAWGPEQDFAIVWLDNAEGTLNAVLSILDAGEFSLGDIFVLQASPELQAKNVDVDRITGGFVTAYADKYEGLYDAFATTIDAQGALTTGSGTINHPFKNTSVNDVRIASNGTSIACAVWMDTRRNEHDPVREDVFARRVKADADVLDATDFQVNPLYEETRSRTPVTVSDENSNFLVVWSDDRIVLVDEGTQVETPRFDVYCRIIPHDFVPDGHRILDTTCSMVSADDIDPFDAIDPDVAYGGGYFVVAWEDGTDIYARSIDAGGTPLHGEFPVNDTGEGIEARDPSVSHVGSSRFLIVWRDSRNQGSLRARVYDAARHFWLTYDLDLYEAGILAQSAGTAAASSNLGLSLVCHVGPAAQEHVIGNLFQVRTLGDLTGEGLINGLDCFRFGIAWNPASVEPVDEVGDLNSDGKVDSKDAVQLLDYRFSDRLLIGKPVPEKASRAGRSKPGSSRITRQIKHLKTGKLLPTKPERESKRYHK